MLGTSGAPVERGWAAKAEEEDMLPSFGVVISALKVKVGVVTIALESELIDINFSMWYNNLLLQW